MNRLHRLVALLLTLAGTALASTSVAAASTLVAEKPVVLYAYHLKPPFIVDVEKRSGLYFDFSDYANAKLGRPLFRTEYLPRPRLEFLVAGSDFSDAVIGVAPLWFKDPGESKFLWSPTLLEDRDDVVSLLSASFDYTGPESLSGKTVGLPTGYYYFGVDELFKKGRLVREDAISEEQNLKKLLARRIDVTIVSRSTYLYLLRHQHMPKQRFFVATQAHDAFARRILISRKRPDIKAALTTVMAGMEQDPVWQKVLAKYR